MFENLKKALKVQGYQFIFGISILSLAFLVTWWYVFLTQSIEKQRELLKQNLTSRLDYYALQLGLDQNNPPDMGVLQNDDRFEIVICSLKRKLFGKSLQPSWPHLCIKVREKALSQIEDEFERKRFMLMGESSFLVLLLLFCFILLYKFIRLEKRSTREIEEFWGRVTHEIKTPITGIKAFLQSLKNRSLDEAGLVTFVNMALKEVEKQEKLAENILAGSVLKQKNVILKPVTLDLGEFIKSYFNEHFIRLSDVNVKLNIDNTNNLFVTADPHALKIILDNITDNAVKYCPPGLTITIRISKQGAKVVIHIRDNGPGFKPEVLENIFEAYKCFDSELPAACRGSGMGLNISRKLAEQMGGGVKAFSGGKGKGAEFQVFLNMAKR